MKRVFFACHLILFFYIISPAAVYSQEMRCDTLRTNISFRQGYSIIEPQYAGNRAALQQVTAWLDSLASTPDAIRSLSVRGSASPEGFAPNNRRLSRKRAESIARHIIESNSVPQSSVKVEDSDIDWEMLRRMVIDARQPWSEEAAAIIADTPVWIFDDNGKIIDGKKRQLSSLGGGKPWFYMSEHFFPAMRSAGYTIICQRQVAVQVDSVAREPLAEATVSTDTVAAAPETETIVTADTSMNTLPVSAGDSPIIDMTPTALPRFTALLKTNMLYDAAAVPNLAVEVAIGEHWSIEAGWMYAPWKSDSRHRSWRVSGGEAGARYWFRAHPGDHSRLSGHHVGIYGQMLTYDFKLGGKGYIADDWSYGAGIAYGYSLPVARHLNIDFTLGVGYLGGKYKTYRHVDDCDVWQATYTRNWFGPTKAEISLVWYIGGNPARKGGKR